MGKHAALKEFSKTNPWFPSLVEGMLDNFLRDPIRIETRLDNLSKKEALTIGKSFALALFDRQVLDAATDLFVNEYGSLIELKKKERFFVPMAVAIGRHKMEQVRPIQPKTNPHTNSQHSNLATPPFTPLSFRLIGGSHLRSALALH